MANIKVKTQVIVKKNKRKDQTRNTWKTYLSNFINSSSEPPKKNNHLIFVIN